MKSNTSFVVLFAIAGSAMLTATSVSETSIDDRLPAELARCRAIDDSLERLRCYDALADGVEESMAPRTDRFGRQLESDVVDVTKLKPDEELAPFPSPVTLLIPLEQLALRGRQQPWTVPNTRKVEVDRARILGLVLIKTRAGLYLRADVQVDPGGDRDVHIQYALHASGKKVVRGARREVDEGATKSIVTRLPYGGDFTEDVWSQDQPELRVTFDVVSH